MMRLFTSLLVLAVVGCGDDDASSAGGPFTFDASAALPNLCPDGAACPGGPVSRCTDGSSCFAFNAHVVTDPPGIMCGAGTSETACTLTLAAQTSLHVTVTGGGTASCNILVCNFTPLPAYSSMTATRCDVVFPLDADVSLGLGPCVNP